MSGYVDGNFANAFLTSNVVSYPFQIPNKSTTALFTLEYVQNAANYTAASLASNSADAPNAYLVEQGPVTKIGSLVKYTRIYCQQPVGWTETQQTTYTFPGLSGGDPWNPYFARQPITLYCNATLTHSYTVSATSPTIAGAFTVTDHGNVVDYIGPCNPEYGSGFTDPSSEPGVYTVSGQSSMIKGLIWEKIITTVPKPA